MSVRDISFVIGIMGNGGAERVISILSKELVKRNYNVNIVCIYGNRTDYDLDPRITVHTIECSSKLWIARQLERYLKLRRLILKNNWKLVISFLSDVNIYTILATLFTKRKLIVSERNDPNSDPKGKYLRIVRNYLYELCDAFVFQTPDAEMYFSKHIQQKSVIIGNPIKNDLPDIFTGYRKKEIVTVSRLSEQKNLFLLVDAFSIFLKECPDYSLIIYGEGPLRNSLEQRIEELRLKEKIELPGFVCNIHELIRESSMFVLSSDYEGISNAMLEALALGLPVIATDCPIGGSRLYIDSYINGILVPVRDVDALSKAMINLATNDELSKTLALNAIKIRDTLNVGRIVDEWEKLIDHVTTKQ